MGDKMAKVNIRAGSGKMTAQKEALYLQARRIVLIWPVQTGGDLETASRDFLSQILGVPVTLSRAIKIEHVERKQQARRSKIHDEVAIRFESTRDRDAIQSYAVNLATAGGNAGVRLDVPDYLRGLFRRFEAHAAALKEKYDVVKRAIRFDDTNHCLYMDVKLPHTNWQRITAEEIEELGRRKISVDLSAEAIRSGSIGKEKRDVLMIESEEAVQYPVVPASECDA